MSKTILLKNNNDVIDTLIKGMVLKDIYPNYRLHNLSDDDNMSNDLYSQVFDKIDKTNSDNKYKIIDGSEMELNKLDEHYYYNKLKHKIGHNLSNSFMFLEKDLVLGNLFDDEYVPYVKKNMRTFNNKKLVNTKFEKRNISKLYKISEDKIKDYHLQYFFLERFAQFRPFNISPMFNNVIEYDYIKPLKLLFEYHSVESFYEKLYMKYKDVKFIEKRIEDINEIKKEDIDIIITEYVKCRSNTFIVTVFNDKNINDTIEKLNKNGIVYYVKNLKLTKKSLFNIMFWSLDKYNFNMRKEYIDKFNMKDNNDVSFIFFDNVTKKVSMTRILSDIDILNCTEYFYEAVELSSMILNKNSLEMLERQNIIGYIDNDFFVKSNLKLQTLRKILYSNMSLLEMDRFMSFGNISLYANCSRTLDYIESILIDIEPRETKRIDKMIENLFINNYSKIYFLNSIVRETKLFEEKYKMTNYKDFVLDPNNYCYFQGLKISTLEFEVSRKQDSVLEEDKVDLYMIGQFIDVKSKQDIKDINMDILKKKYLIKQI
jgi:hypothetical protein